MIGRPKQPISCDNLNHRRQNAPVGHCPQCGGVVNSSLRVAPCDEEQHTVARRKHAAYCVQCGTQLIAPYR
jgi:hypothetical protein